MTIYFMIFYGETADAVQQKCNYFKLPKQAQIRLGAFCACYMLPNDTLYLGSDIETTYDIATSHFYIVESRTKDLLLMFNCHSGIDLINQINLPPGPTFVPATKAFSDENDSCATPEEIQEYLNSNIDYYQQDISKAAPEDKNKLTIADMNKPMDNLSQEEIDRIANITKGMCGG